MKLVCYVTAGLFGTVFSSTIKCLEGNKGVGSIFNEQNQTLEIEDGSASITQKPMFVAEKLRILQNLREPLFKTKWISKITAHGHGFVVGKYSRYLLKGVENFFNLYDDTYINVVKARQIIGSVNGFMISN